MGRKKRGAKKVIRLRLEPALIEKLQKIAEAQRRPLSEVCRFILRQASDIILSYGIQGEPLTKNIDDIILSYVGQNNINIINIKWVNVVGRNNIRKFSVNIKKDIFEVLLDLSERFNQPLSVLVNTALYIFVQICRTEYYSVLQNIIVGQNNTTNVGQNIIVGQDNIEQASDQKNEEQNAILCYFHNCGRRAEKMVLHKPSGKKYAACTYHAQKAAELPDIWEIEGGVTHGEHA